MKSFFGALFGAYLDIGRYLFALPLVFAAMFAVEFTQHLIEWHLGFFAASDAVHQAAGVATSRALFGCLKMFTLFATGFFAIRYFMSRDAAFAQSPDGAAIRAFVPVILVEMLLFGIAFAAVLFIPDKQTSQLVSSIAGITQMLLEPFLFAWYAAAAMGRADFGPIASIRQTRWYFLWGAVLMLIARIPFNFAHYGLHIWARGQSDAMILGAMAVDAVVVGLMTGLLAAVQVRVAKHVAQVREAKRGKDEPVSAQLA